MRQFLKAYQWLLPSLLFSAALILVRMIITGSPLFIFIGWNLILAGLPLYFSFEVVKQKSKTRSWILAGLWLLFLPNSFYITTDIFHLEDRPFAPLWYDLVLLTSAAINGVILGILSLRNMEKWFSEKLPPKYIRPLIFVLLLACGYGIYLGRYLRWNSWDIISSPYLLASDIFQSMVHPFRHADYWLLSVLFAVWMYLLYGFVRKLKSSSD